MLSRYAALAGAAALAWCGCAGASVQPFSGTIQNVTPPGAPGGRCGPPPVLTLVFTPATTTGTSNLGAFSVTASHCVTPTPPVTRYGNGLFSWAFEDGGVLEGTYSGTVTLVAGQPARTVQDYVVTGGTGRFAGARGEFQHVGTFVFGAGGVTTGQSTFRGTLCLEPDARYLSADDFRDVAHNRAPSPSPSITACVRQMERNSE